MTAQGQGTVVRRGKHHAIDGRMQLIPKRV